MNKTLFALALTFCTSLSFATPAIYQLQVSSYQCDDPTMTLDFAPIPKAISVSPTQFLLLNVPPVNIQMNVPVTEVSKGSYIAELTQSFDPGMYDGGLTVTYKAAFGDEPKSQMTLSVDGVCGYGPQNLIYNRVS